MSVTESFDAELETRLVEKFRVLIIGKANAGKTTILQKVCNTTEQAVVTDVQGKVLDPSILAPSKGRGEHDINCQYIFKSQDRFVFHDSRGFEAGSTEELESVKKFIKERASHPHLNLRLHAVWFCIPTDTPRILLEGETSFLEECQKSHVPVVAIFSKFDFRHNEAMEKLMNEGMNRVEARRAAPERARADFEAIYKERLYSRSHPPSVHVYLHGMHRPTANCDDLIRATAMSLKGSALQSLLISTQMNRVHLCVEYALRHVLENVQRKTGDLRRHEMKEIVVNCMIWFPLDLKDLEAAVTRPKEETNMSQEYDSNKRKWVKSDHPWDHWWRWDDVPHSQWAAPWIHLFNDDYLEKLAGQDAQVHRPPSSPIIQRKGSIQQRHTKNQIALVVTGTVISLAYICKPENQGKNVLMETRLQAFFSGDSDALEKLTQAVDDVVEKQFNDSAQLLAGLTGIVLSEQHAL